MERKPYSKPVLKLLGESEADQRLIAETLGKHQSVAPSVGEVATQPNVENIPLDNVED